MGTITISDFQKLEMRVGRIVDVADFPEARNPSYRLRIDFGPLGIKSSSAAVRRWYTKADLLGRSVVAVTNFPPRQRTSDMNGPIWRGGKFVTATTDRPSRSAFVYQRRPAAEDDLIPSGPKSIRKLYDGLRASGKSATSTILPTRISSFWKSEIVIVPMVPRRANGRAPFEAFAQTARDSGLRTPTCLQRRSCSSRLVHSTRR